jgi:hypothetical protein
MSNLSDDTLRKVRPPLTLLCLADVLQILEQIQTQVRYSSNSPQLSPSSPSLSFYILTTDGHTRLCLVSQTALIPSGTKE